MSKSKSLKKSQPSCLRVGIDGNEANVTKRVGSNVYAFEVIKTLEKYWRHSDNKVVVFLRQAPRPDLPAARPGWRYEILPNAPLWTWRRLPQALHKHRQELDVFFSPGHYTPLWSPLPTVPTIMDLAYEFFPQQFRWQDRWQLKLFTRLSVRQASQVLAISRSTASDLEKYYHLEPDKIMVAYPGYEPTESPGELRVRQIINKKNLSQPYFLFIGTLQPRKNLPRLIKAFELIVQQGYEGKLVIIGKIGWQAEPILQALKNSPVSSQIKHLGFVDNEEKKALIAGAQALVLPGLYEGFGIPPLEAIRLNTIPLVADVSSLPEVVPINQLRFDPLDHRQIAAKMTLIHQASQVDKKHWLSLLQDSASKFTWQNTVKQVEKALLSAAKNR